MHNLSSRVSHAAKAVLCAALVAACNSSSPVDVDSITGLGGKGNGKGAGATAGALEISIVRLIIGGGFHIAERIRTSVGWIAIRLIATAFMLIYRTRDSISLSFYCMIQSFAQRIRPSGSMVTFRAFKVLAFTTNFSTSALLRASRWSTK